MKRVWLLVTCGLLLFAQQLGLTHAVWHAYQQLPAQQVPLTHAFTDDESSRALTSVCAMDATLAQVLGAGPPAAHSFFTEALAADAPRSGRCIPAAAEYLTPRSRGPPFLS